MTDASAEGSGSSICESGSNPWRDLHKLFHNAEQELKAAEHLNRALLIPAVNELRYAGYHAIRGGLATTGQLDDPASNAEMEFDKASRHCQRAIFDTVEIQITYYLSGLLDLRETHGRRGNADIVCEVVTGYSDDVARIASARRDLERLSKDGHRDNYYSACKLCIHELRQIHEKWLDLAPLIDARVRRARRNSFLNLAGVAIAILTLLLTFVALLT